MFFNNIGTSCLGELSFRIISHDQAKNRLGEVADICI